MSSSSPPSDLTAIQAEGRKLAPWHLGVEIAPGLTTADLNPGSDRSGDFYEPGPTLRKWFTSLYPGGLEGRSAFDCACNNGAFLFALKEIGAGRCFGSDVRSHWIDQAQFLAKHRHEPSDDMEWEVADLYELPDRGFEPFDIGIFAGVFYHLPNPIRGLQIAADLTKEVLVVSTASRGDLPEGRLVSVTEATSHPQSGVHGLAFFPTGPEVLIRLLAWMGFPAVRRLNWWTPPGTAPELDSIQLIAAREERFLTGLDTDRPAGRRGMLRHIRETTRPRAPLLVVRAKGSSPVQLGKREVWEIPRRGDDRPLIAQLEDFRAAGAEHLVVPSAAFPWLDENPEFKASIDSRYAAAVRDPTSCIVYDLRC